MVSLRRLIKEVIWKIDDEENRIRAAKSAGVSAEDIFGDIKEYRNYKARLQLRKQMKKYLDKSLRRVK